MPPKMSMKKPATAMKAAAKSSSSMKKVVPSKKTSTRSKSVDSNRSNRSGKSVKSNVSRKSNKSVASNKSSKSSKSKQKLEIIEEEGEEDNNNADEDDDDEDMLIPQVIEDDEDEDNDNNDNGGGRSKDEQSDLEITETDDDNNKKSNNKYGTDDGYDALLGSPSALAGGSIQESQDADDDDDDPLKGGYIPEPENWWTKNEDDQGTGDIKAKTTAPSNAPQLPPNDIIYHATVTRDLLFRLREFPDYERNTFVENAYVRIKVQKSKESENNQDEDMEQRRRDEEYWGHGWNNNENEGANGGANGTVNDNNLSTKRPEYIVARVSHVLEGAPHMEPYSLKVSSTIPNGKPETKKNLRSLVVCRRGREEKAFKLSIVSNKPITAEEWKVYIEWRKFEWRKQQKLSRKEIESDPRRGWEFGMSDVEEAEIIRKNLVRASQYYFTDSAIDQLIDPRKVGNSSIRLRLIQSEVEAIKQQLIQCNTGNRLGDNSASGGAHQISAVTGHQKQMVLNGTIQELQNTLLRLQEEERLARELVEENRLHFEGISYGGKENMNDHGTRTLQIAQINNRNHQRQDYLDLNIAAQTAEVERRQKIREKEIEKAKAAGGGTNLAAPAGDLNPFARKPMNFVNMWDLRIHNQETRMNLAKQHNVRNPNRITSDDQGRLVVLDFDPQEGEVTQAVKRKVEGKEEKTAREVKNIISGSGAGNNSNNSGTSMTTSGFMGIQAKKPILKENTGFFMPKNISGTDILGMLKE